MVPVSFSVRGRRQSKTNRVRLSIRLLTDMKTIVQLDLSLSNLASMDTQQARRRIPKIQFRVLIIGRANAGKTSILQRVCETTNSPITYRNYGRWNQQQVRGSNFVCVSDLTAAQIKIEPTMDVSDDITFLRQPLNMIPARRTQHRRRTCVL